MTVRAVVGFFFDQDGGSVVLLRKQRPAWQAGLLNGPGGKIEPDETPLAAMVREFHEETGAFVDSWRLFSVRRDASSEVYFFSTRGDVRVCRTTTNEAVEIVEVSSLHREDLVCNLRWLVPLALEPESDNVTWTIHST